MSGAIGITVLIVDEAMLDEYGAADLNIRKTRFRVRGKGVLPGAAK
ncbi:hypothetical protein [Streptomyces sp. NPDC127084]